MSESVESVIILITVLGTKMSSFLDTKQKVTGPYRVSSGPHNFKMLNEKVCHVVACCKGHVLNTSYQETKTQSLRLTAQKLPAVI